MRHFLIHAHCVVPRVHSPALFVKRPEECFCANWRNGIDTDMVDKEVCYFMEEDAQVGKRTVCQPKMDKLGNSEGTIGESGGVCPSDMKICTAKFSPPVYPECTCSKYAPPLVESEIALSARMCDKVATDTCYEMHQTYDPKLGDAYSYYGCPVDMTPCAHKGNQYKLMDFGTNECPGGYKKIRSRSECAAASKALKLHTVDGPAYEDGVYGVEDSMYSPSGCYLWSNPGAPSAYYSYSDARYYHDGLPIFDTYSYEIAWTLDMDSVPSKWPDEVWFNEAGGDGNAYNEGAPICVICGDDCPSP